MSARTPAEIAAWKVLRRRGMPASKAAGAMAERGFPLRTGNSWRHWEHVNGFTPGNSDAARYVVTYAGRPMCWGSRRWCASVLGVTPQTVGMYAIGRIRLFAAERRTAAPCELMDGCAGNDPVAVRMLADRIRASTGRGVHSGKRLYAAYGPDGCLACVGTAAQVAEFAGVAVGTVISGASPSGVARQDKGHRRVKGAYRYRHVD